MDRMTLSVAMCTYNGEAYLPEQLISIAAQTRQPDELVICDDCSSDGTVEIVKEFASHAPLVVRLLQNNENLGSTKNFAKAFGNCRFDVIAPSDQDDFWYPDKLQSMEEVFIKNADAQRAQPAKPLCQQPYAAKIYGGWFCRLPTVYGRP